MLTLFREKPGRLVSYINRIPKPDGGNPTTNRQALALGVIAFSLWTVFRLNSLGLTRDEGRYTLLFYLGLIAAALWRILFEYVTIVYCGQTKAVYKSYIFFRRRLIYFRDITEIRIVMQEENGFLRGAYMALRRGDPLKKPVRLSPWGLTGSQLNHYSHNIIPRVKTYLWGENYEEGQVTEVKTESVSVGQGARPAPVRGRSAGGARKDGPERPAAPARYRKSFWLPVLLPPAFGALLWVVACWLITTVFYGDLSRKALFDRYFNLYSIAAFLVIPIPVVFYPYAAYRIWKLLVRYARRNVNLTIDAKGQKIVFRTVFGLQRNEYTFDSLIELTVKHRWGLEYLCLVLDGQYADPVANITSLGAATRKALDRICAVQNIDPKMWVDVYLPVRKHSEGYRQRILRINNPYYEK